MSAVVMPSGSRRFNFTGLLPAHLPASLEASHGHIRYHIEAVLDITWKFDKRSKLPN